MAKPKKTSELTAIGPDPKNKAKAIVESARPYSARVTIRGVTDILFHAWDVETVAEASTGGNAKKGSKGKKTDNLESYVYRTDKNEIAIPGTYLYSAIQDAAKFWQDPRSPKKSARDLYKAAIVVTTKLATLGKTTWDYVHRCRAVIQRSGITRARPAFLAGWEATFDVDVILPEYVDRDALHKILIDTGRFIGLADFRPTYGRFQVIKFEVLTEE